jgi:hypothetical protein
MGLKLEAALVETLEPKQIKFLPVCCENFAYKEINSSAREKSTSKAVQMILNLLLWNYNEYQPIVKQPI